MKALNVGQAVLLLAHPAIQWPILASASKGATETAL
jgi:hypothetical protein